MGVLEVFVGGPLVGLEVRILGLAAGDFGVGVSVDRDEFVQIHF
jgi:hypothetical protein